MMKKEGTRRCVITTLTKQTQGFLAKDFFALCLPTLFFSDMENDASLSLLLPARAKREKSLKVFQTNYILCYCAWQMSKPGCSSKQISGTKSKRYSLILARPCDL